MKVSNVVLGSLVVASIATAVQASPVVAVGLGILAAMTGSWAQQTPGALSTTTECQVDPTLSEEWKKAERAYCELDSSRQKYNELKTSYETKYNAYVDACRLNDDSTPVAGELGCASARQAAEGAADAAVEAYGRATGCKQAVTSDSTCPEEKKVAGSFLEKYNEAVDAAHKADRKREADEYNKKMPKKFVL